MSPVSLCSRDWRDTTCPLEGLWCIGWQNSAMQSRDGKNMTLLGDLVLSNKLVVYDLENQVIGWTEYNCELFFHSFFLHIFIFIPAKFFNHGNNKGRKNNIEKSLSHHMLDMARPTIECRSSSIKLQDELTGSVHLVVYLGYLNIQIQRHSLYTIGFVCSFVDVFICYLYIYSL
ncbi:hypothetical protein HYC85_024276 [Camellia sinensis]|uniref:Peptidase A1 domain-containing protein n=1 Tax=Camellia sinensis TaxID=4442 RepID=A0A7J7G7M1_CAMSI|nr:hypothetical protein HYC85_024276 [Camellia sinensis]